MSSMSALADDPENAFATSQRLFSKALERSVIDDPELFRLLADVVTQMGDRLHQDDRRRGGGDNPGRATTAT